MADLTKPQIQEAILAREILSLGLANIYDSKITESLSDICFSMFRYQEERGLSEESTVNWHELFSLFDQLYYDAKPNLKKLQILKDKSGELQQLISENKSQS